MNRTVNGSDGVPPSDALGLLLALIWLMVLRAATVRCNPLVIPTHPDEGWQAWCKGCSWEGPARPHFWQAKNDKLRHEKQEPEWEPWQRGPAR